MSITAQCSKPVSSHEFLVSRNVKTKILVLNIKQQTFAASRSSAVAFAFKLARGWWS
jgi:hypothetical protein